MTNTKEFNEAVEKLAKIFAQQDFKEAELGLGVHAKNWEELGEVTKGYYIRRAKTAIDALGIEIVSKESELKEDDLLEHPYEEKQTYYINDLNDLQWINNRKYGLKIYQRNNKPAVYLENIKGAE